MSMPPERFPSSQADPMFWGRRAAIASNVTAKLDYMLSTLAEGAAPDARAGVNKLRAGLAVRSHELIEDVALVYAEVYTLPELQAFVAFLEGPAGQAMLLKQPLVEARLQKVSAELLQKIETG